MVITLENVGRKDNNEMMNNLYEFHILEPQNEEINAKMIIAVEDATYAVLKRKAEEI